METIIPHPEDFTHIRIIMGMILGLSLARLVNGLTRFIQHPGKISVYPVHLAWVFYLLLSIVHFWWFEFHLSIVQTWTFSTYLFLIVYSMLFATLTALLFPDEMKEYAGFKEYFFKRRGWFFGILAITCVMDVGDTLIKGREYFVSLGMEYIVRQILMIVISISAIFVKNAIFHYSVVVFALIYQVSWILRSYDYLN